MILPDINLLVYAQRRELPEHERYRLWLEAALNGDEPVALVGPVVSGFLRLVTNRRVFVTPTPLIEALEQVEIMLSAPAAVVPDLPGAGVRALLAQCRAAAAAGDLVADAYLAAVATVLGADLLTADRDFARFPGLRWRHPFQRQGRRGLQARGVGGRSGVDASPRRGRTGRRSARVVPAVLVRYDSFARHLFSYIRPHLWRAPATMRSTASIVIVEASSASS